MLRAYIFAAVFLLTTPAVAQVDANRPSPTSELANLLREADRLPPERRLGLRAALVRRAQRTIPSVVLVSDARSYVDAISAWDGHVRYPVLIDDGSVRAAEDIARFVRAFAPERVERWETTVRADDPDAWPDDLAGREAMLRSAWAHAVGLTDPEAPPEDARRALLAQGLTPPGLVVTHVDDPAWTGALALAAARFQVLGFVDRPPGRVPGAMDRDSADALETSVEALAEASGLSWRELGDDLDAVTLALNCPVKLRTDDDPRATSDLIGRLDGVTRWAWTSQLVGDEAQSAYRAMCALFLEPRRVWLFDAYPNDPAWEAYHTRPAADLFRRGGAAVTRYESPNTSLVDWRQLTLAPLDAEVVFVNSSGNPPWFDLNPGRAYPADAPHLQHPAILSLIHSFSLASGDARSGVGGRWMERGVYAQLGSVHEPYLQSFVPPQALAARLIAGYPFAAAVRIDNAPLWKLAVMGDPLLTLSNPGTRLDRGTPLREPTPLEPAIRESLADEDFAGAIRTLALLGRDTDAARLATGLLKDRPDRVTPEVVSAAIGPAFRDAREDVCLDLARASVERVEAEPVLIDLVWTACRARIARGADDGTAVRLMQRLVRDEQIVGDAWEIAIQVRRRAGADAAGDYIESLVEHATRQRDKDALMRLAREFRAGKH